MEKIYVLSLGCPRNLLDSEVLLGKLKKKGFSITEDPMEADVAIVNTCGFVQDAKEESIDAILRLVDLKKEGKIKKLIVSGCLPQRYPQELMDEIKEIDGVFGTSDFTMIPERIEKLFSGKRVKEVKDDPDFLYDHLNERQLLTSSHSVYVKIQEGCSNRCSYCVIPDLKGPRRSREIESVLEEISTMKSSHDIKELILIGQDTTSFGFDRGERQELPELLKKASSVMNDGWVRLLYTHPAHFTDELIDVLSENKNVCRYVDLPIQHINNRILKEMNRRVTKEEITDLIRRIREKIEGVTIRTSIIVGFPGETQEEFDELVDFLGETRFDRLGCFIYSQEEGTPAASFGDQVPEDEFDRVMRLQQEISLKNNQKFMGKKLKVLIDEKDPVDAEQFIGRSEMDAPEVDGVIYVRGENLKCGDFKDVVITGTMEYDLIGELA
ncbi:30S ribosomal protein S12 methylthiotransferase RimO [Candidatus Omnitrophota bacterium]